MQVSKNSPVFSASRGARLIDLVKQNKINISPQLRQKTQRRFSLNEPFFKDAPKPRLAIPNEEDYLKFSNQLKFDPNASPSSSILSKRKGDAETPDQSPFGSSSKVCLYVVALTVNDLINLSSCSVSASDSEIQYPRLRSISSHQKKSARNRAA